MVTKTPPGSSKDWVLRQQLLVRRSSDIVGQTYTIDGGQMSNMYETGPFKERRQATFGQGYVEGVKSILP